MPGVMSQSQRGEVSRWAELDHVEIRTGFLERYLLALRAYRKLIHFDGFLAKGEFEKLRTDVSASRPLRKAHRPASIYGILRAVDTAAVWYWKQVLCLQRSATVACLLRESRVPASVIVGVQQVPFKAHAWVEVDGQVVGDKPYVRELYRVLDTF